MPVCSKTSVAGLPGLKPLSGSVFKHALRAATLLLAPHVATAALVTYTVQGTFTGVATGNGVLVAAVNPLVGGQSLSLSVTLDTAAPRAVAFGGETLYSAVTASSVSFAGFASTSGACPSVSEFICKVRVRDGTGVPLGTGADQFNIFPAIARSAGLEAATGLGRTLDLQFNLFFNDFTGTALTDDGLDFDLTTANRAMFTAGLSVFAASATGSASLFDRADFAFRVIGITNGSGTPVPAPLPAPLPAPEPGSLALALLGLAALGGGQWRRKGRDVRAVGIETGAPAVPALAS